MPCYRIDPAHPLARRVLQAGAEPVALEARPHLEKALVEQLAPRLEIHRERLEAAPGARVRGPRREPRVEVVGVGRGAQAGGTCVGRAQLLQALEDARQLDVAV